MTSYFSFPLISFEIFVDIQTLLIFSYEIWIKFMCYLCWMINWALQINKFILLNSNLRSISPWSPNPCHMSQWLGIQDNQVDVTCPNEVVWVFVSTPPSLHQLKFGVKCYINFTRQYLPTRKPRCRGIFARARTETVSTAFLHSYMRA